MTWVTSKSPTFVEARLLAVEGGRLFVEEGVSGGGPGGGAGIFEGDPGFVGEVGADMLCRLSAACSLSSAAQRWRRGPPWRALSWEELFFDLIQVLLLFSYSILTLFLTLFGLFLDRFFSMFLQDLTLPEFHSFILYSISVTI